MTHILRRLKQLTEMARAELASSRSAPLYHWAAGKKLKKLFSDDILPAMFEHKMLSKTGISMTRSKFYRHTWGHSGAVVLRLNFNQAKLAARFRIVPINAAMHGRIDQVFLRDAVNPSTLKKVVKYHSDKSDRAAPNALQMVEEYVICKQISQVHRYLDSIHIVTYPAEGVLHFKPIMLYLKKWDLAFTVEGDVAGWNKVWAENADKWYNTWQKTSKKAS